MLIPNSQVTALQQQQRCRDLDKKFDNAKGVITSIIKQAKESAFNRIVVCVKLTIWFGW